MTAATKRNYRATFILDTRGREETADQLVDEIKNEIASTGIEVGRVENLGRREFARKPDPKMTAGNYVQYDLSGPPDATLLLREHFKHNTVVFRIMVQSL
jgi:small subunit ribosomal protein S6